MSDGGISKNGHSYPLEGRMGAFYNGGIGNQLAAWPPPATTPRPPHSGQGSSMSPLSWQPRHLPGVRLSCSKESLPRQIGQSTATCPLPPQWKQRVVIEIPSLIFSAGDFCAGLIFPFLYELSSDIAGEVDHSAGIAPFIVVPGQDFSGPFLNNHRGGGVNNS